MRKIVSKFALAAGIALAMAFTFSCSSDDGSPEATSWYSLYRIDDDDDFSYILDLCLRYKNPSSDYLRNVWIEVKKIGTFVESDGGVSEQEAKEYLIQVKMSPKEADDTLIELKKRGNILLVSGYSPPYHIIYVERE